VTFASGYQVVYQAIVVVLAGFILYAFMNAHRQRLGLAVEPIEAPELDAEVTL
jgi:APA family basic amino acid/polyamine antiporter